MSAKIRFALIVKSYKEVEVFDITVVGGGIIGLSCAYTLAKNGLKCILIEQSTFGGRCSSASLGALWPSSPLRLSAYTEAHWESLRIFPEMAKELEETSGMKINYQRCGSLKLLTHPSQHKNALLEAEESTKHPNAPDMKLLTEKELADLEPNVVPSPLGALYCPSAASVDTSALLEALIAACRISGVTLREKCTALKILRDGDKISGVYTAKGEIRCEKVVLCCGSWTSNMDPYINRFATITPVKGQACILEGKHPLVRSIVRMKSSYIMQRGDSLVCIGSSTEPDSGFDEKPTGDVQKKILENAIAFCPKLKSYSTKAHLAGLRPRSRDRKPYIGKISEIDGLYIAAGHYKTGFSMMPFTATYLSELITSGNSEKLAPFTVSRKVKGWEK
ncbi:MAG: FAD-binding oxidoreductase [Candidatus Dadabacteria bacterium]|nr:MAG: FAD-binding oxidoreductase [Candidatus Dadabacteria bacterium]